MYNFVQVLLNGKKCKVIGIRKDKRFIIEDPKTGKKEQLSDYDIKNYVLVKEENDKYYIQLDELKKANDEANKKYRKDKEDIESKMDLVFINDYKEQLLNEEES